LSPVQISWTTSHLRATEESYLRAVINMLAREKKRQIAEDEEARQEREHLAGGANELRKENRGGGFSVSRSAGPRAGESEVRGIAEAAAVHTSPAFADFADRVRRHYPDARVKPVDVSDIYGKVRGSGPLGRATADALTFARELAKALGVEIRLFPGRLRVQVLCQFHGVMQYPTDDEKIRLDAVDQEVAWPSHHPCIRRRAMPAQSKMPRSNAGPEFGTNEAAGSVRSRCNVAQRRDDQPLVAQPRGLAELLVGPGKDADDICPS
jgi:hypothetical protein